MPSEEALRAARAIRAERIQGDRPSSVEADAEIIDAEFRVVREALDEYKLAVRDGNDVTKLINVELFALRAERDKLRKRVSVLERQRGKLQRK